MNVAITISALAVCAKNAYVVYGHPSPFAFIGFVRALLLKTGYSFAQNNCGVAVIIHDFAMFGSHSFGGRFLLSNLRSAEREVNVNSQVDIPRANMTVTLIFQIDVPVDNSHAAVEAFHDEIPTMRLAGGTIYPVKKDAILYDCGTLEASLSEWKYKIKPGYVMKEKELSISGEKAIESFLEQTLLNRDPGQGWVTPSLRGFRLMEEPQIRNGARKNFKHAFVDPLIGAAQFSSWRKTGIAMNDFWHIQETEDSIIFATKLSNGGK